MTLVERDQVIEAMKAAMEKEKAMKDHAEELVEDKIEDRKEEEQLEANEFLDKEDILEDQIEIEETEEMEEMEEEEATEGKEKSKSGKSLFKNNKGKASAAKDQKIEELNDRMMRTMAEFDNYRKRSEKEKAQMYEIGAKNIIEKILPIVDNFERGLGTISEDEKDGAFAQGIEKIYKQLLSSLEEVGVKKIDAVGKEFDPNLHNAVMHSEDENFGENIVSDEFQKGYFYRDAVVRHSMVKVVN